MSTVLQQPVYSFWNSSNFNVFEISAGK
jgi:hypothetical protein